MTKLAANSFDAGMSIRAILASPGAITAIVEYK
jgi:hypothetical protein